MRPHPVFNYLHESAYNDFSKNELVSREQTGYPPFRRLVEIDIQGTDDEQVTRDAEDLAKKLRDVCATKNLGIEVLGPARPLVYRIAKTERCIIYLKATSFMAVHYVFDWVDYQSYASSVCIVLHE